MLVTTAKSIAVLALATITNAHMIMKTPVPYGKSSLNNSPLDKAGADFPCKQRAGVYNAEGASNVMPLGSKQPLEFIGSAVHGGGSCQVSITYDKEPTASSVFKVIHSIEGGCPIQGVAGNNGNDANAVDPSTYSFTIPSTLPLGEATMAWTWFNKIGNREMYMNCAPATITAGSSKRDSDLENRNITQLMERDQAAFDALPNMFLANIGQVSAGCGTVDTTDLIFPNAGDSVERLGLATSAALARPTGPCATAAGGSQPTSPASATTASSAASTTPVASSVAFSAPSSSSVASSAASSLPGGVFATTLVTSATSATSATATAAPTKASPTASAAPTSSAPAAPISNGPSGVLTGSCSPEGLWNCIGGTSFQQCASGSWSVDQPVAGGTKCTPGQSSTIEISAAKGRRSNRFTRPQPPR